MKDFKAAYDAVQAAIAKVNTICDQMEAAFGGLSEEEIQRALDMRPELEAAQAKAEELGAAYDLMIKAQTDQKSNASRFVPAGLGDQQAEDKKTVTRAEYESMTPQEKHDFFKNGGAIE
jgi:hypothetical protein